MAEKRALLPPGSTPLERKLATVNADIEDIPLPIRDIRRAEHCPPGLLTWLAWERSVDRWDDTWSTDIKRKALRNSFFVHQRKGTIGALRRVVEPLGYLLEVREWWQMVPEGRRGTFTLSIGVLDSGITQEMYPELERLIDDAKRLSQHLIGLSIQLETRGSVNLGGAFTSGDILTIYPPATEDIEVQTPPIAGLVLHHVDTLTVYAP